MTGIRVLLMASKEFSATWQIPRSVVVGPGQERSRQLRMVGGEELFAWHWAMKRMRVRLKG